MFDDQVIFLSRYNWDLGVPIPTWVPIHTNLYGSTGQKATNILYLNR